MRGFESLQNYYLEDRRGTVSAMAYPTEGNIPRAELKRMIASIREAYGLSIREYAKICGVPIGSMRQYAFSTTDRTVSPETAGNFIAPFSFGFSPEILPKRKDWRDGHEARWKQGPPPGMQWIDPLRDEIHAFKEDEKSSWPKLAAYFGVERRVFTRTFSKGQYKQDYITDELAEFYRKELRKAKTLSPARREQLFRSRRGKSEYLPRDTLRAMIASYRHDFDIPSWRQVAEDLGEHPDTLRGIMHNQFEGVRRQTFERVSEEIREARIKRQRRIDMTHHYLDRTFMQEAS